MDAGNAVDQKTFLGIRLSPGVRPWNLVGALGLVTLSIVPLLLSATVMKSFLVQQCGVDPVVAARKATWVAVLYVLGYALGSPLFGYLSDRWGRRAVVLLGFLLAAPFHALTGFLTTVEWVVAAQALVGLGQAGATSMLMFAAINYAHPDDRPKVVGLCGAAIGVGVSLSLPLGSNLFHSGHEMAAQLPFLGQAIVSVLCSGLALVFLKGGRISVRADGATSQLGSFPFASLVAPRMLVAYGTAFLLGGTGKIFGSVLKPWGLNAHLQAAGGIGMALLGAAFGFVALRFGPFRMLALGLLGLTASYFVMTFCNCPVGVTVAFLASAVFVGMIYPVPLAIAFSEVPDGWNGTSAGIHQGLRVLGELMFALLSEAMFLAWFPATAKLAGLTFPLVVACFVALLAVAAWKATRTSTAR